MDGPGGPGPDCDGHLLSGSRAAADLAVCHLRLQDDARWPWLVLIPRRPGLVEVEDLRPAERALLMEELVRAGAAVRCAAQALGRPVDKLNLGALGNVTRQLHLHVVGRRLDDPARPGPVWGVGTPQPYAPAALALALDAVRAALAD